MNNDLIGALSETTGGSATVARNDSVSPTGRHTKADLLYFWPRMPPVRRTNHYLCNSMWQWLGEPTTSVLTRYKHTQGLCSEMEKSPIPFLEDHCWISPSCTYHDCSFCNDIRYTRERKGTPLFEALFPPPALRISCKHTNWRKNGTSTIFLFSPVPHIHNLFLPLPRRVAGPTLNMMLA